MATDDILSFVRKALPWVGAAATGNVPMLVTMAAKTISEALGTEVQATPDAITQAIAGATPEQIMALKQADNDFALKMREFGYKEATELVAMEFADTASARARDTAIVTVTGKTNTRANAMLIATLAALVLLVIVMLIKDIDANTALGGIVILLIGKFSNAWDTAFQFEFGTTRSSKAKDNTITALTK